jgi:ribosomal protein L44E
MDVTCPLCRGRLPRAISGIGEGLRARPLPPWGSTSRPSIRGSVPSDATSVVAEACAVHPLSRPPSSLSSEATGSRRWRCERGLGAEPWGHWSRRSRCVKLATMSLGCVACRSSPSSMHLQMHGLLEFGTVE